MKTIGKLEKTDIDIVIDIDGINIRPATTWEMKYGYKPDVYIVRRTDSDVMHCLNSSAAWIHANAAMRADKLNMFGFELGNLFFIYEPDHCRFVFDCVMNPNVDRYRVEYTINDEPGFVLRPTFASAKEKANEEYGRVRPIEGGPVIYWKKESDNDFDLF